MRVQSPVGTFPVRLGRPRLVGREVRFDAAMGVWRSEVTVEREDLSLLAGVVAALAGAFLIGRLVGRSR